MNSRSFSQTLIHQGSSLSHLASYSHQFLDLTLCLTLHIQPTTIFCWLYIQNISRIPPSPHLLARPEPPSCYLQAWILATAWSSRCHRAPYILLNSAVSEILSQRKSDHITSQHSLVAPDVTWITSLSMVYEPFYTLHPSPITSPPHFFLSNLCSYAFLLWTPHQLVHQPIPLSSSPSPTASSLHGYCPCFLLDFPKMPISQWTLNLTTLFKTTMFVLA